MPAAAALAGLLLACTPLGRPFDRAAHDLQARLLAPRTPSADVVVFDIDDASLARLRPQFGPWPFSRDVYAVAIDALREAGARAIALNLLLADTHPGDQALARAVARPGAPVLLAAAGLRHASDLALPEAGPAGPPGGARAAAQGQAPAQPWPVLALPAASVWPGQQPPTLGVVTAPLDADGMLRSLPLWHRDAQRWLPGMPMAVALALGAAGPEPAQAAAGLQVLALPGEAQAPPVRPFAELAAAALGAQPIDALRRTVAGRVVFIGSSALLADSVMTAQGQWPGSLVLAQASADLLRGSGPRPPAPWLDAGLLVLAVLPALWAVRQGRQRPAESAWAACVCLLLLGAVALCALWVWHQPTAWTPPLAALGSGLVAALAVHHRGQRLARLRLARALDIAAAAARAKSAFLATVSHELRTPLNALLGVAELLQRSPLSNEQQRQVQLFRSSGQALQSLIDDLLDLSRIESGRLELRVEPFALQPMLEQLLGLVRPLAAAKGLQLQLRLQPGLPQAVLGDGLRLQQALLNLLGNAIKFTAAGRVHLAVHADPADPLCLRFDVSDTGIGIAAQQLDAIFEPFVQADGSVTRQYGGSGLGLAITRQVMALMGGTVQVRSTPGQGSTFTLRLRLPHAELPQAHLASAQAPAPVPAAAVVQPGDAAPAAAAAVPAPGRVLSVLLAEDNEVNAYIVRAMLDGEPVELQHAPDGHAALALLQQQAFDIAFIDVQMPGLDGLAVTAELRALEARTGRRATPVVALTANAFDSDVQASLAAGCQMHLAKPCSREQLLQAMAALTARTAG